MVTNVYWVKESNLAPNETIYYNPAQLLTWADFTGAPNLGGNVAALTMSGFGYKAAMTNAAGRGQINIGVYCYFSKPKSWVKPNRKNEYILKHEQNHFDITYIAANIFVQKLREQVITPANINQIIPKIYRECCDIMSKMQDDYDDETNHGQTDREQYRWDALIEKRLAVYNK